MSSGSGRNSRRSSDSELEEGEIRDTPSPGDDHQEPGELGKGEVVRRDAPSPDDREGYSGRVEIGSKANTMSLDILTIAATASREEARRSQESSAAASSSSEDPSALRERVLRSFFPGVATSDMIEGCEMVLLMEKPLDIMDVSPPARRLTLPKAQLQAKFLRKAEKEVLKTRDENGAQTEMKVLLLGPSGETCHLRLIRLDLKNKSETVYHLVGQGWVDIVARNGLEKDQVVRLYCCRIASNLCFALVCP
ncbi:putative B3 domain-containing protein At3g24850 [Eucalyptus grandis]|uniref:putative B3 domain-containing protein At3g24850 n=1 Tax=Eucalyptus grandis TaxID=71139 RepID=UPI00192ED081|nr:putative B3 domain-containing protein At3g24850 [Eucalyptus grandis]